MTKRLTLNDRWPEHPYGPATGLAEVPDYAFVPDQWTQAFQAGLSRIVDEDSDQIFLEVGVGGGFNALHLLNAGAQKVIGSDLDKRLPVLAARNTERTLDEDKAARFQAITGASNLLEFTKNLGDEVDTIVACIPQAIKPLNEAVHPDDLAHYYDPDLFAEYDYNEFALGLNEALLAQAKEKYPEVPVILNLGGRVGIDCLNGLFFAHGYKPTIVSETVVAQHAGTSLKFFTELEPCPDRNFTHCEFFADLAGTERISAEEAEERRKINHGRALAEGRDPLGCTDVFHKIYVVKGVPISSL